MRAFVLIAVMLLLPGCRRETSPSGNPPGNQEPPIPIQPLGVGKSWSHRILWYDTAGSIVARETVVTTITFDTLLLGEHWFGSDQGNESWLANRADGLYSFPWSTGIPALFLKHPAARGEHYHGGASGEDSVFVVSTNSSVTVPRGTYACVRYRFAPGVPTGLRASAESWYSPGIGEIWTIVYGRTAGGGLYVRSDAALIDFSL